MKKIVLVSLAVLMTIVSENIIAGIPSNFQMNYDIIPVNDIFIQNGNINTVFRTDGVFNSDKVTFTNFEPGFIWPSTAASRMTVLYTSGIWIGAKAVLPNNQKELRLAASFYNSHFSPGNIPVTGQVPPVSVCNDPSFNGYLVNLVDQTLVNGGTRNKVAGGRTYTFVYSPWSAWPVNQGAPYVEVNSIPGYQPGWSSDRPGIGIGTTRPSEVLFVSFMDFTNCTGNNHMAEISLPGGTLPLGVEIHQLAYMFDIPGFSNTLFTSFKVINKSSTPWDSTYISLINDGDLGDPNDDKVGCDSVRNLGFTYNGDNQDPIYGANPPAVGYRMLQGPVIFTGNTNDTARLPCSNIARYRMLKMTGHNKFTNGGGPCSGDPDTAASAFNFMRGMDGCGAPIINPNTGQPTRYVFSGNPCAGNGWLDNSSDDKRNLLNCGPFTMSSGDTQVVTYVYAVGRSSSYLQSVCEMQNTSDYASMNYFNCFSLIGISNISTTLPLKYSLEQNYPNPFNPVTDIKFGIPLKGFVNITVFDALGRVAEVLVDEEMTPGTYKVDWNAVNHPSGIYFYRLISNEFTDTKKMVLVK